MFFRSILAITLSAVALVYAVDVTQEIYVRTSQDRYRFTVSCLITSLYGLQTPGGESADIFCPTWEESCIVVTQSTGTPYSRCGAGYDGDGTFFCLSSRFHLRFLYIFLSALSHYNVCFFFIPLNQCFVVCWLPCVRVAMCFLHCMTPSPPVLPYLTPTSLLSFPAFS